MDPITAVFLVFILCLLYVGYDEWKKYKIKSLELKKNILELEQNELQLSIKNLEDENKAYDSVIDLLGRVDGSPDHPVK